MNDGQECFKYFDQNAGWEQDKLSGEVSSIKTYRLLTVYKGFSQEDKEHLFSKKTYTAKGKILSLSVYDKNKIVKQSIENQYSVKGFKIKTTKSTQKQGVTVKDMYEHTESGEIAKFKEYLNGDFVANYSMTYDIKNKISVIKKETKRYTQKQTHIYEYDESDRTVGITKIDSNENSLIKDLKRKETYLYNKDGFLIENSVDQIGDKTKSQYELDKNNCLKKRTDFNSRGLVDKVYYYYKNGTFSKIEDHKTLRRIGKKVLATVYKYTEDNYGNWIIRKSYSRSNPKDKYKLSMTERREIEYF